MGIRFKLANLLFKDYLRNYLMVGVRLPLLNIKEYSEKETPCFEIIAENAEKAIKTIDELYKM